MDPNENLQFYRCFVWNYLRQLARFAGNDYGKTAVGKFDKNVIANTTGLLKHIRQNCLNPVNILQPLQANIEELALGLKEAIKVYFTQNGKDFAIIDKSTGAEVKIKPSNDVLFNNLSVMLDVVIFIHVKNAKCQSFGLDNDPKISVRVDYFEESSFNYHQEPNDSQADAESYNGQNSNILFNDPFLVSKNQKNLPRLSVGAQTPRIEPNSKALDDTLRSLGNVLAKYRKFLNPRDREELIDYVMLDERFFNMRNSLQSCKLCSHGAYHLFKCGERHCKACFTDLVQKNGQGVLSMRCICNVNYTAADISDIGVCIQTLPYT